MEWQSNQEQISAGSVSLMGASVSPQRAKRVGDSDNGMQVITLKMCRVEQLPQTLISAGAHTGQPQEKVGANGPSKFLYPSYSKGRKVKNRIKTGSGGEVGNIKHIFFKCGKLLYRTRCSAQCFMMT